MGLAVDGHQRDAEDRDHGGQRLQKVPASAGRWTFRRPVIPAYSAEGGSWCPLPRPPQW